MSTNEWGTRKFGTYRARPRKLFYNESAGKYDVNPISLDNLTLARERNATKFTALCEAISNLARAGITRADDIALVTGASVPAIYRAKRRLSHGIETAVTVSHGIACDPLLA